jgi:hypothetical protein
LKYTRVMGCACCFAWRRCSLSACGGTRRVATSRAAPCQAGCSSAALLDSSSTCARHTGAGVREGLARCGHGRGLGEHQRVCTHARV